MKNKKSQSHLEMILSFVIFVGFVLFLLIYLNPIGRQEALVSLSLIDRVQTSIFENLSINYSYISLVLNQSVLLPANKINDCFELKNLPLDLSGALVLNSTEDAVPSVLSLDKKDLAIVYSGSERFYTAYFSPSFNSLPFSKGVCDSVDEDKYSLGTLGKDNVILANRINELNRSYFNDYKSLREDLHISADFDFAVYNETRGLLFSTLGYHKLKGNNILTREIPLIARDSNAKPIKIIFFLEVWK